MSFETEDGRFLSECGCGQCPEISRELHRVLFEHRACPGKRDDLRLEVRTLKRRIAALRRAIRLGIAIDEALAADNRAARKARR